MPRWGEGRWGESQWGEGSGPSCVMTISLSMIAGVLLPVVVEGAACAMSLSVGMTAGTLTELTLPAPKGLRLVGWLRPAL